MTQVVELGGERGPIEHAAGLVGRLALSVVPAPVRETLLVQVFSSGVRALPMLWLTAVGAGAAVVLQTGVMAPPPSGELGRMLVVVVLRELSPLLTAILVSAYAGDAIVAHAEEASAATRWTEAAKVAGTAVSTVLLAIHFAAFAMLAGFLVSQALTLRTWEAVQSGVQQEIGLKDLPLFVVKAGGLGAIVGWCACRAADRARLGWTHAARETSRAFVRALAGCLLYGGAVTLAFYALTAPPVPP